MVLVAWAGPRPDLAHHRRPPHPGEKGLCWANGLFEASGTGGYGKEGGPGTSLKPLRASGSQNLRSGGRYWGQIISHVTVEGLEFGDQSGMDLGEEVVDIGHGCLQGPGLGQLLGQNAGREDVGRTRRRSWGQ